MKIHIIGAQKTNYPWGFENRVISELERMGHEVLSTDFRQERDSLAERIKLECDLVLVFKGEGISPNTILSATAPTALWYAEQIGTTSLCDDTAKARRAELAYNVAAFDYVFSHDAANLDLIRELGAWAVAWAPTAASYGDSFRPLNLERTRDVVFAGTLTPRRQAILAALEHKGIAVEVHSCWDPGDMNVLFNESKIVLNIHLSDIPNTETRVAEVLGAGAFLLTEALSSPGLVIGGIHAGVVENGDVQGLADQIAYFLSHDGERDEIARAGHQHICLRHSLERHLQVILDTCRQPRENIARVPESIGIVEGATIQSLYESTRRFGLELIGG